MIIEVVVRVVDVFADHVLEKQIISSSERLVKGQ